MRHSKEDLSSSNAKMIDLISAVKELHGLSSQELNRLLRGSENFTIHYRTRKGSTSKIDMERLAGSLPLHLIAVLISSDRDEAMMKYVLCGIRLLHTLCDLSPRHSKLEQIFLDDVKVLEQLIDLVFYVMTVLGGYRQEGHTFSRKHLLHSALVACSLHLLTGFISTQWQDIVHVLLAHPKVDMYMDVAFGSVRMVVRFLEMTLSGYKEGDFMEPDLTAERVAYFLAQQCEVSLQFLQSVCQQKLFKERLLKNKELCGNGSILFLIRSILKIDMQPYFPTRIMAALSRLKSKILSLLLSLCEAENASYLDEVASSAQSLDLAKCVALEVFDLLKTAFGNNPQTLKNGTNYPMGFLQLNAMRLAEIFSDDSNFRTYMTTYFTKVVAAIFMLSHGDFLSCWCSSNLPEKEEDATLEYDIFAAAGWILDYTSSHDLLSTGNLEFNLVHNSMPQASYAHHRTSLFVKVIANLHCFVPNICEEQERNLFVLKVLECLQMDLSNLLPGFSFASDAPNANGICKNLRSLISHAESLIPNFLNVEDVHLLRVFSDKLESLITSGFGANRVQISKGLSCEKFSKLSINEHQEAGSPGGCSSPSPVKEPVADLMNKRSNLREGMSENSAFLDINNFNVRAEDLNQGASLNPQDRMEDKTISGKTASEGARDADKDAQNVETSGSDTSFAKGKSVVDYMDNIDHSKSAKNVKNVGAGENPEDEKVETQQRKRRKRTIMNDEQVMIMERAVLDEPEMQRNAASLLSWAEKLSHHGSEVTPSQLKNWLNNRKAKLARTARDVRVTADVDASVPDKLRGPPVLGSCDTTDSPSNGSNARKELPGQPNITSGFKSDSLMAEFVDLELPESGRKTGQYVVLVDKQGEEIGKGKVFQVSGRWCGKSLEQLETCVVDVYELIIDKGSRLPYPSEATGSSFTEAETKLGVMRVLWDANRTFVLRSE